jgi:hypothetical protein
MSVSAISEPSKLMPRHDVVGGAGMLCRRHLKQARRGRRRKSTAFEGDGLASYQRRSARTRQVGESELCSSSRSLRSIVEGISCENVLIGKVAVTTKSFWCLY